MFNESFESFDTILSTLVFIGDLLPHARVRAK